LERVNMAFGEECLRVVGIGGTLRGVVAPLMVTIPGAWQRSDDEGNISDDNYGGRLDRLGNLVIETAEGLNPENRRAGAAGVAV
jgi:FMN reductase